MNYEPVIGLEIHVQTKTKSKMFCGCSTDYFGAPPNTFTCPTCLGLPGALPVPNKKAVELAIIIALALNCTINKETKFDRKNYFYPDLPKGYQITQYDQPVGIGGHLAISSSDRMKNIRIRRVHQEEDTGKSIHQGTETLLDFNKSGVPLVEIVTEPDFSSGEEVTNFAKQLRQILRYLDASDADMEKGQMRIEPNISIRKIGEKELPTFKVEVKNIGSISVLDKVITKEIIRQKAILENGDVPRQETRGLVDMTGETVSQRSKETEADYRYFPEPDIPPIILKKADIEALRKELPELPEARKKRYIKAYDLATDIAEKLILDHASADFFDKAIGNNTDKTYAQELAKWYVGDFAGLQAKHFDIHLTPKHLAELITLLTKGTITRASAKDILAECFETEKMPSEIAKDKDLEVEQDDSALASAVKTVISSNPKAIEDMKKNPNAVMFLVGQVMKEMKGKADAQTVKTLILDTIQH